MTGTLVNTGAVIAGSAVGLLIHSRLPRKIVDIVFQGIGLFTITIGISMSLKSGNMLLLVMSIVLGAIIGQAIDLDRYLRSFSEYLQRKYARNDAVAAKSNRFTEGFITASMLFCVGSMSILGAIEDSMGKSPDLLYTKSLMDGISSIALASSFGVCIAFSSIPLFLYQGGLTLFAGFIMQYMSESMRNDMTAVGGVLLIGLGVGILKIKDIRVINMLPSLVIVVILSWMWG